MFTQYYCLCPHCREREKDRAYQFTTLSLLKESVSTRWLCRHWGITHRKRFPFFQVNYWLFLLSLKIQGSAEGMYLLIRKVSLHSQVAYRNCFLITAWLRGIEFFLFEHGFDEIKIVSFITIQSSDQLARVSSVPEASNPIALIYTIFDLAKTLSNLTIKYWLLLLWIFILFWALSEKQSFTFFPVLHTI